MSVTRAKYTGTALPTDSDTFVLFTTVETGKGANFFAMLGVERFSVNIKNSHAGTIKTYKSMDRGTNWLQVSANAVGVPSASDENVAEYLVGSYIDWKVSWVNGGTTQTTFGIDMSLHTDRSAGV